MITLSAASPGDNAPCLQHASPPGLWRQFPQCPDRKEGPHAGTWGRGPQGLGRGVCAHAWGGSRGVLGSPAAAGLAGCEWWRLPRGRAGGAICHRRSRSCQEAATVMGTAGKCRPPMPLASLEAFPVGQGLDRLSSREWTRLGLASASVRPQPARAAHAGPCSSPPKKADPPSEQAKSSSR